MKNFYHILGLSENASLQDINDSYKKLALKFHPDKNNDDPFFSVHFKQINDARQVLTHADEKAEYDLLLTNYSDAYDVIKQQRLDDEFNRQIRRQQQEKLVARKKILIVMSGVAIFLSLGFIILAESDIFLDNNIAAVKPFREVLPSQVTEVSKKSERNQDIKEASVFETDKPLMKEESPAAKDLKEEKRIIKPIKAKEYKTFSQAQLQEILQSIYAEKIKRNFKTNCITLKRTKDSNVDEDLSIAAFLQQNGFIISGRETISNTLEGYKVEFNGVCLNLTIGRISTSD